MSVNPSRHVLPLDDAGCIALKWFYRFFDAGGFGRKVALLAGSVALGQALVVAASPLLTRLYTPADFGVLAAYVSLLSIVVVLGSLRYELAIPIVGDEREAFHLLLLAVSILLIVSTLAAAGVALFGARIVAWTGLPALRPYLWLLPVGLLAVGAYQILNHWAIRQRWYGKISRTRLGQSVAQVAAQLSLGLGNYGVAGLIVGYVLGQAAGSGTLASDLVRQYRRQPWPARFAALRQAAWRHRRFPLLSGSATFLNTLGSQLPPLLLAASHGAQVAGWFALGQRILGMPMYLIGNAAAQVYLGEAPKLAVQDTAALWRLFTRTLLHLAVIGLGAIALIAWRGPALFAWAFGAEWSAAGHYVQLLGPMFVMQFIVVPVSQTLNVLERQDLQLLWDGARLLLVIAVFAAAPRAAWSDQDLVAAYGIAMAFAYLVLLCLCVAVLRRCHRQ